MKAKDKQGNWHKVHVDLDLHPRFKRHTWRISESGHVFRYTSIRIPGRKHPKGIQIWLHREVMGLGHWHDDKREVNHKNRDKLDNRRNNLEILSHRENMRHWMKQDGRLIA